ncbi:hypothetical protein RGAI101_1608 [Roseobacter sp. GAI101]|nr:hypothetical protein RGAI101_1608 [Roseobacter sp. GAI101]
MVSVFSGDANTSRDIPVTGAAIRNVAMAGRCFLSLGVDQRKGLGSTRRKGQKYDQIWLRYRANQAADKFMPWPMLRTGQGMAKD